MEWVVPLVLLIIGVPIGLALWLISRALRANEAIEQIHRRQSRLESEILQLKELLASANQRVIAKEEQPATEAPLQSPKVAPIRVEQAPLKTETLESAQIPTAAPTLSNQVTQSTSAPPLISPAAATPFKPVPSQPSILESLSAGKINWEQFVGVKLLMWVGGFAAFLTVVFAVKYSFERNWITPALRVASGFLTGIGLLVAGVVLHRRKQYVVGAQTFCATGIVILYATTFACRSIYHFNSFGLIPAF